MSSFNPYNESANILVGDEYEKFSKGYVQTRAFLEDTSSPINRKFQERLYQSILDKGHIDFDDIPKSKGDIKKYRGYANMKETLNALEGLDDTKKNPAASTCITTVKEAIANIESLTNTYEKGFSVNNEYVMLEYCTYVYTCVQATTAILYEYVDYIKMPDKGTFEIPLRNTNVRADLFYIEQLTKFNTVNKKMGIEYRKMLENAIDKGKQNFAGVDDAFLIGLGAVAAVSFAIVPVTRALIYHIYRLRGNISDALTLQAEFLEMNKTCVEANSAFTKEKKSKILKKQEELRRKLLRLSDIIKVKTTKSRRESQRELDNDNKTLSISNIKRDVSDSPLELI